MRDGSEVISVSRVRTYLYLDEGVLKALDGATFRVGRQETLGLIGEIADNVAVMYVDKMAERAETEELFLNPKHPYTEALLSAIPRPTPEATMQRILPPGEVANPARPPAGCSFHPRCGYAQPMRGENAPLWDEVRPEHFALCHLARQLDLKGVDGGKAAGAPSGPR